jgi:hypothetical protein
MLAFAVWAYNLLRFIGLIGLTGCPLRHPAKRWSLRTVIQKLISSPPRRVAPARPCNLPRRRSGGVNP